jgi:hypothetical protein
METGKAILIGRENFGRFGDKTRDSAGLQSDDCIEEKSRFCWLIKCSLVCHTNKLCSLPLRTPERGYLPNSIKRMLINFS